MTSAERTLIGRSAEFVAYPAGMTLFQAGEEVRHVLLPQAGLVSLLTEMPCGDPVPTALVGREGLVGLPGLLGDRVEGLRATTLVATHGLRIETATLQLLAEGSRNLRSLVRRYAMVRLAEATQGAACNLAHPLEQRLARQLLALADRLGPNVPVTQEHLAAMVGAQRPTVNLLLRGMRGAGLLRHARGQLAIADRAGLEKVACPCHRLIREARERLLPGAFG